MYLKRNSCSSNVSIISWLGISQNDYNIWNHSGIIRWNVTKSLLDIYTYFLPKSFSLQKFLDTNSFCKLKKMYKNTKYNHIVVNCCSEIVMRQILIKIQMNFRQTTPCPLKCLFSYRTSPLACKLQFKLNKLTINLSE